VEGAVQGPAPALRDSLFQALAASDSIGVAVCDREFRCVLWNRFMEAITGLAAAEVLGRHALDVYPHLREQGLEHVLHRVLAGETVSLPDRRYTVPGVRSGWMWAQYWPHRGPDGTVGGVIGIVHPVYDRAIHARSLSRLRLETDLRRALDRGGLTVHYQPIVALGTGRIRGIEALARWWHAERGWVAPNVFVSSAEESGMIVRLGQRVLGDACRQLRAWSDALPAAAELGMSVNLSVRQFAQPELAAQVKEALDESGIHPSRLSLEVTESVLLDNAEAAAATLHALKELGVRLWMDDFGTGYSSLSTLHRLPIDGVKVDRSFLAGDGRAARVLAAVVGLAQGLGLEVVAEGVERAGQLAEVRALGCDAAQGFLFSRPQDADATLALLASAPAW
jgi:PAS domain S-box-containing protein